VLAGIFLWLEKYEFARLKNAVAIELSFCMSDSIQTAANIGARLG
jgi:hypothetical protein